MIRLTTIIMLHTIYYTMSAIRIIILRFLDKISLVISKLKVLTKNISFLTFFLNIILLKNYTQRFEPKTRISENYGLWAKM